MNFLVCIKLPNSCIYAIKLRWNEGVGWGGISGMSCISCKEIAFLTIINLKNANYYGAAPLDFQSFFNKKVLLLLEVAKGCREGRATMLYLHIFLHF